MAKYKTTLLSTLPLLIATAATAGSPKSTHLPNDVNEIIERKACCGHWSGEEPYDAERKKQIEDTLQKCKCSRFDADLKKIEKKYKKKKDILKAIEEASNDG